MTNTIEIENFFLLLAGVLVLIFAFVSLTAIMLTLLERLNSKERKQVNKKQSGRNNNLSNDEVKTAKAFINAINKVKKSQAPKAHAERRSRFTSNIVEINKFNDHRNRAKQEVEESNEALADIVGYSSSNNLGNANKKFNQAINGDDLEFEDDIEFDEVEDDVFEDYDERTYG